MRLCATSLTSTSKLLVQLLVAADAAAGLLLLQLLVGCCRVGVQLRLWQCKPLMVVDCLRALGAASVAACVFSFSLLCLSVSLFGGSVGVLLPCSCWPHSSSSRSFPCSCCCLSSFLLVGIEVLAEWSQRMHAYCFNLSVVRLIVLLCINSRSVITLTCLVAALCGVQPQQHKEPQQQHSSHRR